MPDPAIEVEQLSKRYRVGHRASYRRLSDVITGLATAPLKWRASGKAGGDPDFWALRNVSFKIEHGEIVGIIGPNGAGKSTLLKILSRVTSPTSGRATTYGRVGSLLEVGTGFHPELSGRENIFLSGAILGMRKSEITRKFDEIVAFAEVERFLDTQVKHYSSGMYERLAFAVAAHLEPEILVVDEVLAVGDLAFQKKCLGKMSSVASSGRTVLFVSHNMGAIREICSRVVMLRRGEVVADGESEMVVRKYMDEVTSSFPGFIEITSATPRVHSIEDSRFKWTHAKVTNSTGETTGVLGLGESFILTIQGQARTQLKDLRVGFALATPLGGTLFNSFQIDHGLPADVDAGGWEYRVVLDTNILAPGIYEVHLGAVGPGVAEWEPNVMQIQIQPVSRDAASTWKSYSHGSMRYPCAWSARQLA